MHLKGIIKKQKESIGRIITLPKESLESKLRCVKESLIRNKEELLKDIKKDIHNTLYFFGYNKELTDQKISCLNFLGLLYYDCLNISLRKRISEYLNAYHSDFSVKEKSLKGFLEWTHKLLNKSYDSRISYFGKVFRAKTRFYEKAFILLDKNDYENSGLVIRNNNYDIKIKLDYKKMERVEIEILRTKILF
jgi:hypothetical protein